VLFQGQGVKASNRMFKLDVYPCAVAHIDKRSLRRIFCHNAETALHVCQITAGI